MTLIQLRGGTAAQWVSANPILAAREPGVEFDTGFIKVGNGTSAWNSLPYAAGGTADNTITNIKMADDAIGVAELAATGTASASTFLSGSGTNGVWANPVTDAARFLVFAGTWPARPNDDRRTFFLGGATASNAPVDANLRTFDVWIPAS